MAKITLDEQSAPSSPGAGKGIFYVKDDDPSTPHFISDTGVDIELGVGGPVELLSKDANLTSPSDTEDATVFYTPIAITATEVRTVIRGTGGGLLLNHALFHSTDRSAAGNSLTVGQSYTGTTAGVVASLSDATIPAASYIWMQTAGSSGTVNEAHVHLRYSID